MLQVIHIFQRFHCLISILGRPADGLAVDTASEATADTDTAIEYQSYLLDARKAVRDRYEATRCWQYDYDGLNPPPMTSTNINTTTDDTTTTTNNNKTCDTINYGSSELSTPYGSGPVSLTEEEDRDFWSLMRSDEASFKVSSAIKRLKHGDNLSLSSGGWSSSHEDVMSPRDNRPEDIDHSISTLGPFLDLLFEKVELMPNNNLTTNLLVTSVISQLGT